VTPQRLVVFLIAEYKSTRRSDELEATAMYVIIGVAWDAIAKRNVRNPVRQS
jgi:hypothetical protein